MFSVQGIGDVVISVMCNNEVASGAPLRFFTDHEVIPALTGQTFHGVVLQNKKGVVASVQIGGFVTMAYTGTDPAVGYKRFILDGEGIIKVDTSENVNNPLRLVVDVDTDQKLVTFML